MRRIISLFVLAAILPLVVAGGVLGAMAFRRQHDAMERQAMDLAGFAATLIGRELAADKRSVQMIAQSPALDRDVDVARFTTLARRLLADEPTWRAISVADPDGRRLLDVPGPIAGKPGGQVVDLVSLTRTVESGRPQVGSAIVGPRGKPAFAVRAPVIRDGRVRYVVSAVIDPQALGRLLGTESLPAGWSLQVVDGAGRVVVRAREPQASGRMATSREMETLRRTPGRLEHGERWMDLTMPIEGGAWRAHLAFPAKLHGAPLQQSILTLGLSLVSGLALALAMGWLLRGEMAHQKAQQFATLETQRLEALGRMTGGVAHDFNNLLTPIIGGLDLLQRRLADDPKGLRVLEGAMASAERARILVSRLLAFARRQPLAPQDIDVAALLQGLADLLEQSTGEKVRVNLQLDREALHVKVDPAQLELAVLNLAINGRDAMPDGGQLTIAAEEVVARSEPDLAAGRYVRVSVMDTGAGMDAATLKHAIEPFFTTKEVGRGTGLGLSMVHGLAAQSGGVLRLSSEVGVGTTAEIWLPAGVPGTTRPAPPTLAADDRVGGLLLVDDDVLVRTATAEVLRDHGHAVWEAGSAAEALKLLDAEVRIEALVTDFAMPGRSGVELIREARVRRPSLPALLITGYAPPTTELPADVASLGKPFRRAELLSRISGLLKRGDAALVS